MVRVAAVVATVCLLLLLLAPSPRELTLNADRLQVPPGWAIELYAAGVPNARQLVVTPGGTVFAGSRSEGKVHAIVGAGARARVSVIAEGLNMPSGVAFRDGTLFVAEVHRIIAFDRIEERLDAPPAPRIVTADLPRETHHGWKYLDFGPDGLLYVPVGAPCNVCEVEDPFGTILRMQADGSDREVVARGVRNSVGFTWHPDSGNLWFTDNGRDWLGDDVPGCELNRATAPGQHFGFPYIHAGSVPDPEFGDGRSPADFVAPALVLEAHVAPLGLVYLGSDEGGPGFLVAEHGSWNRSRLAGYQIILARLDGNGQIAGSEPFVTGWRRGQSHWGRPVDLERLDDGSFLISDDQAGAIYRLYRTSAAAGA